jgi:hypothetical protein
MKIVGWTIQNNGQLRGLFETPELAADWLSIAMSNLAGPCSIVPIMEPPLGCGPHGEVRQAPKWDPPKQFTPYEDRVGRGY